MSEPNKINDQKEDNKICTFKEILTTSEKRLLVFNCICKWISYLLFCFVFAKLIIGNNFTFYNFMLLCFVMMFTMFVLNNIEKFICKIQKKIWSQNE